MWPFRQVGGSGIAPMQRQPLPNQQRQIPGPPPGIGLRPSQGSQRARNGIAAPFGATDPINGPGRDGERIQQALSGTPYNRFLAEMVPDSVTVHYRHAHRIRAPQVYDYPLSPFWPDQYAKFQDPGAYTSIRPVYKTYAPIQLQRSAGGLIVADYQRTINNVNVALAPMYLGAQAPTSANQSGACK